MFELLIVRPYRYADERQQLIEEINDLWNHLIIPNGVRIVHAQYPEKVVPYKSAERLFPFIFRCWIAYREWLRAPAKWVCITDADIMPLRKDALFVLLNELSALPNNVELVSASYLTWLHKSIHLERICLSAEGLCAGAPDGLHTIKHTILPHIAKFYHHYSGNLRQTAFSNMFAPEPAYAQTIPPTVRAFAYTLGVLLTMDTWDRSILLHHLNPLPAFVQFVGDLRLAVHHINDARYLLEGG